MYCIYTYNYYLDYISKDGAVVAMLPPNPYRLHCNPEFNGVYTANRVCTWYLNEQGD